MTSQPPLLEGPVNPALPGPQFAPRPGWGGQLKRWFSENSYRIVFRLVILCALVLVARSLWANLPARDAVLTPAPSALPVAIKGLAIAAQPGDGMTDVAARALDLYLAVRSQALRLDGAQHLYAVDTLARAVCWCPLEVGQEVLFPRDLLESATQGALTLTPRQHAAWERLLR